ncbi:hypothetical protein AGMMS49938_05390 [Fibrobacterales bacterium]|nr:hypothetical protein AGMMS49938_05390 [Fibrobacterales bacterium]
MSEESTEQTEDGTEQTESAKVNRFKIAVTKDQMEVRMYPLISVTDGGLTTFEEVLDACKKESVQAEIDEKLVEKQLLEVNPTEVTIAKGKKPHDGKDGYIEYRVDMSAKPQFIADPKDGGSVDYKNSMRVTLVSVDDVLADIIPPSAGEDGFDVRGHKIDARPGAKASFFLGEGLEEKDGKIVAIAPGTPSIQDDVIMIRRNYVLQGDVDLSTGNINFPGTIIIHGNVSDDFEVVSEENIVINGLISGAKIKAKGYVKCAGGIQGKKKAEIIAGSFVAATFVSEATIIAEGDVVITKEVLHSNISCLGELRMGGTLIGGVTTAFKGVECGNLGSESGVKTTVNIRTHYRQEKAKELANSVLADVNAIFERYRLWNKSEKLNEEESKLLLSDIIKLQGLISKRQMFDSRVAKFDAMVLENKTAKVKILGTLEADATIASPYSKYNCTSPIKGPLSVTENNSSAKMAVMRGG